jgi:hypothetical protein
VHLPQHLYLEKYSDLLLLWRRSTRIRQIPEVPAIEDRGIRAYLDTRIQSMSTSSARASLWGRDPEEWSDPPSWSEAFQDNLVDNLLMMACHREVL